MHIRHGRSRHVRSRSDIHHRCPIAQGRPVIDLRGRYETVSDASKAVDANAITLRARLGYETGSWNGLSLQADFDQIWAIGGAAYNSTRNGKTMRTRPTTATIRCLSGWITGSAKAA